MALGDGLNWRRGIDTLQQSNDKVAQALAQRQAQVAQQTQVAEERNRYQTSQIVQGIKGIGDAIDNEEKKAQQKTLFDQTTKLNELEIQQKTLMNPLQLKEAQGHLDSLDASTKQTLQNTALAKHDADRRDNAIAAESAGIIQAAPAKLMAKMPDEIKEGTPEDQANWIKGNQAEKGSQISQAEQLAVLNKTQVETGNIAANTLHTKAATAQVAMQLGATANMSLSALNNARLNPDTVPLLGRNPEDPAVKAAIADDATAFAQTKKDAAAAASRQRTVTTLAKLGGAPDLINPTTGQVDEGKLNVWVSNLGGWDGFMKQLENNPNAGQAKVEVARLLNTAITQGLIQSFGRPGEMQIAQKQFGGEPMPNTEDEAKSYLSKFNDMVHAEGKAGTFFQTEISQINELRDDARKSFTTNNGFQYIAPGKKGGVLWDLTPDGKKMSTTQESFMALTPQQQANLAYGFTDGKPNYDVPDHWSNNAQLTAQLQDPVQFNKIAAQLQGPAFSLGDPQLDSMIAAMRNVQSNALAMVASPGSLVGTKPGQQVATNPSGVGFSTNVSTGNPNTPVVYDAMIGEFRAVGQPSGLPAAGATPSLAAMPEYPAAVAKKYQLSPQFQNKNIDTFNSNKRDTTSGAAYAQ